MWKRSVTSLSDTCGFTTHAVRHLPWLLFVGLYKKTERIENILLTEVWHRYLLPKSLSVHLSLILKRDSCKGIRALSTIHLHPPPPNLFWLFTVAYLGEQWFVPIGTNKLHLTSSSITSKSCYFPKQIGIFSVHKKAWWRIFTLLWAMVSILDFFSYVLPNPWNTWLFNTR